MGLLRSLRNRLLSLVPTVILATLVVFGLQQLIPGDPAVAIAGDAGTPERLAEIRANLGLDRPLVLQYLDWLGGAFTGDLGDSFATGEAVWQLVMQRLPTTLTLAAAALTFAVVVGVPLGVAAARRRNTAGDTVITGAATLGIAVPNFWLGMMLVLLFAIQLGWFPATGYVSFTEDPLRSLWHVALPAIALGAVGAAEIARQLRSALIEVFQSDFMRTHRAKGLPGRAQVWRHALKNAGIPLTTIVALQVNRMLGATVVVEALFALPGVGSLVVQATTQRDYPVIQGVVFVIVILVVATNLVADQAYRYIDPRIRA